MRDSKLLTATQNLIWESGAYMPKEVDGEETTYCNLATQAVFEAFGYKLFTGMTADQMMAFIKSSADFLVKPMADCQFLANEGTVIVAGLTSEQLKQGHGHVCTITPGDHEDFSGKWNKKTPLCLSIGRKAICFRSKGVNWAFVPEPEFYAWKPTL